MSKKTQKLKFTRVFSSGIKHPFEEVEWVKHDIRIEDEKTGKVIFEQKDVEAPSFWSPLAVKIVVSKYFYGDLALGTDPSKGGRESSVRQLIDRVSSTIAATALSDGYMDKANSRIFYEELTWLLLHQYAAFNSPVWFNLGLWHKYKVGENSSAGAYRYDPLKNEVTRTRTQYEHPQCSACFLQSVEDNMDSIMALATSEAMLFKFGSGTGSSLSSLRSSKEKLTGGGRASGPMSFLRIYDQIAGTVKSGGKNRRAAKLNTLNDNHPDIEEFIDAKPKEEMKARALIAAGYESNFNGEAYSTVAFQNENLSVRVTDDFMRAAIAGEPWWTIRVTDGQPCEQKDAKTLLRKVAEGTWLCGDPGMQFDTTIQKWHTCKETEPQHTGNPCQPGFATVLAPDGIKTFDDISVGSIIWSGKQWTKVKRKIATGIKPVFRYETPVGNFVGTECHYVFEDGKRIQVRDAEAIDIAPSPNEDVAEGKGMIGKKVLLGDFPVFDIEVEAEEHSYWSDGLLVSNCSEFLFLDGTACNLASTNLIKFKKGNTGFEIDRFRAACKILLTAQEVLVDFSSYPTEDIAANSHTFRPLGLGFANLGALIMSYGFGYDSKEGRALAACVTALMGGAAYHQSALMAQVKGAFWGLDDSRNWRQRKAGATPKNNFECMTDVITAHASLCDGVDAPYEWMLRIKECAQGEWTSALLVGKDDGWRNSQVTLLPPCGTIGFMMDCDTTGIEPELGLVKYKTLAGRGMLKIVNQTVGSALNSLGYTAQEAERIMNHIKIFDTIEDVDDGERLHCSGLNPEHLHVFDCSFTPDKGNRSLSTDGHLGMMAACQPFLSGGISKTINMPNSATVDDIVNAYIKAWRLGLKCVAIYRDGSKSSAPLSTKKDQDTPKDSNDPSQELRAQISDLSSKIKALESSNQGLQRRKMPETRESITHTFSVAGHKGYITCGLMEDRTLGEMFITMSKEGSTIGGLMDTVATLTSIALQYGVPLETLVRKFSYQRFEPSGFTNNADVRNATSLIDYVFRWLGCRFIPGYRDALHSKNNQAPNQVVVQEAETPLTATLETGFMETPCANCGSSRVVKTGSCGACIECGTSAGCS